MSERVFATTLLLTLLACCAAAAGLVDPTRPPTLHEAGEVAEPAAAARLTAVLVSPERRIATLDGRVVRVGDRVGDARVVAISLTGVRLIGPEGSVDLPLVPRIRMKRTVHEE